MWNYLATAKRFLWEFVELGFLAVLALVLISLLLGPGAGSYVTSVMDNVTKFTSGAGAPGLVGIVIVVTIVYLIMRRMHGPEGGSTPPRRPRR
jgi:hypothetical protein